MRPPKQNAGMLVRTFTLTGNIHRFGFPVNAGVEMLISSPAGLIPGGAKINREDNLKFEFEI